MEFIMIIMFAVMMLAMASAILTIFGEDVNQMEEIGINLGR